MSRVLRNSLPYGVGSEGDKAHLGREAADMNSTIVLPPPPPPHPLPSLSTLIPPPAKHTVAGAGMDLLRRGSCVSVFPSRLVLLALFASALPLPFRSQTCNSNSKK